MNKTPRIVAYFVEAWEAFWDAVSPWELLKVLMIVPVLIFVFILWERRK